MKLRVYYLVDHDTNVVHTNVKLHEFQYPRTTCGANAEFLLVCTPPATCLACLVWLGREESSTE